VYRNFSIVVVLIFAAFAGVFFYYQKQEFHSLDAAFEIAQNAETAKLEMLLKKPETRLVDFASEYSLSDTLAASIAEGKISLGDHAVLAMNAEDVDFVCLLDLDVRQSGGFAADNSVKNPQLDSSVVIELRNAVSGSVSGHFFFKGENGRILEMAYSPIQPSSDKSRVTAPKGYFVAVRIWDADFVNRVIGDLVGNATIIDASSYTPLARRTWIGSEYHCEHAIAGRSGDVIAYIVMTAPVPVMSEGAMFYSRISLWFFCGMALLCALTLIVAYLFVGWKLRTLLKAMKIGDMTPLEDVKDGTDFGTLAEAVKLAYEKKQSQKSASLGDTPEGKLIQREKFLTSILRHVNGAVLILTREGILSIAEGKELDAFGFQKERDLARPISSILRGQERLAIFENSLRGKRVTSEQKVGDRIFATVMEPFEGIEGKPDYVVVLAQDITEKRQSVEMLAKARQEVERADRIKTQFLSVMSHETRTPLNGVLGFASVLRETPLNEEQTSYLDRIVDSGQNLLRLLTDILDLARLEAGEGKRNMGPVSLQALVYQFAERYRIACQQKGRLSFDLDVDQRLPDFVESDNEMISRILSSLLDNAVKFTDAGSVKFTATWVPKDKDGKSGVVFTVSDTGPGIAPEIARDIFNPFHQGDSSNTRKYGGLGLGLTIAHKLATQLEGRLTFETKMDVGTTFTFFLPTKALDESVVRSAPME
jgi:signal transduction histidine kinase